MSSLSAARALVENALPLMLPETGAAPRLLEAMRYSLLAGGKRVRPCLCILSAALLDVPAEEALYAACAVEMIHTYSLIHDDLPVMDNDTLRRGRPTCHVVYGEALALLAGDALLTHAFATLALTGEKYPARAAGALRACRTLSRLAGIDGMVAGQVLDIQSENGDARGERPEVLLDEIQRNKTAALLQAALLCGLELGNPSDAQRDALSAFGLHIGLAFQAADDILDATSTPEQLGKTPGKDLTEGKLTWLTLHSLEETQAYIARQTTLALQSLALFGEKANDLRALARELSERKA